MQMYPESWRRVLEVYNRITSRPFGYLFLDVHPASDDRFPLWSHLTKAEGTPQAHTEAAHVPTLRKRPAARASSTTTPKRRWTTYGLVR